MSTNLRISTLSPDALRSLTSSSRRSKPGTPRNDDSSNDVSISITSSNSRLPCDCTLDALNKENKKLIAENNVIRHCLMLTKENSELKTVNFVMSALSSCDEKLQKFMRDVLLKYPARDEHPLSTGVTPSGSRTRSTMFSSGRDTPSYGKAFEDIQMNDLLSGTSRGGISGLNGMTRGGANADDPINRTFSPRKTMTSLQNSPAADSSDSSYQKGALKINILDSQNIRVEKDTGTGENPIVIIRSNASVPRYGPLSTPSPSNVDNSTYSVRVGTRHYRDTTPSPSNVDNSTYESTDTDRKYGSFGLPTATSTPVKSLIGDRPTYNKAGDFTYSPRDPSLLSPRHTYARTNSSPISVSTSPRALSAGSPYRHTSPRRAASPSPRSARGSPSSRSAGKRPHSASRRSRVTAPSPLSLQPASYAFTPSVTTLPRNTMATTARYTPTPSPRPHSVGAATKLDHASGKLHALSSFQSTPKPEIGSGLPKPFDTSTDYESFMPKRDGSYLSPTYTPRSAISPRSTITSSNTFSPRNTASPRRGVSPCRTTASPRIDASSLAYTNSQSPRSYLEITPTGLSSGGVEVTVTPPTPCPSGQHNLNASPREPININISEAPNATTCDPIKINISEGLAEALKVNDISACPSATSSLGGGRVRMNLLDPSAPISNTRSPQVSISISSRGELASEDSIAAVIGFEGYGAAEKANAVLYRPVDQLTGYIPKVTLNTAHAVAVSRPTRRLVGEIAFQLEHRILVYVFSAPRKDGTRRKSNRFYGYCLANIMQMITREAKQNGELNDMLETELRDRLYNILRRLRPFGFSLDVHSEFSQDVINRYGLLNVTPEQTTIDGFSLNDPGVLRLLLGRIFHSERLLQDMLVLLDCLYYMSQEDQKPLFMW